MIDNKALEQLTSLTLCSVLHLVHRKNQVPYFKAVTDSNLTRLLLKRGKKCFKKKCI